MDAGDGGESDLEKSGWVLGGWRWVLVILMEVAMLLRQPSEGGAGLCEGGKDGGNGGKSYRAGSGNKERKWNMDGINS